MIKFIIFILLAFVGYVTAQKNSSNPAADQLPNFLNSKLNSENMTTSWGAPVSTKTAVLTAGPGGPILLQDTVFLDEMAHFSRERIPERLVHAKGSGAYGHLKITNNSIAKYTKAKLFSEINKTTPCFFRFSTVAGEMGSPDTVRDVRGIAGKFYTEEGNWDLVGINLPVFFIRDPILFPSLVHAQKRNPVTNLHDPNMVFDFMSQRPETMHALMRVYTDLGIPNGYRKMDGFGAHAFKLVNANGGFVYCKFHLKSKQGNNTLPVEEARNLTADDPDYAQRDLYNAIANGSFPKWDLIIQVMTPTQANKLDFNPFDVTKIWPESQYISFTVGTITLDRNPTNYFEEVEQAAFAPSRMVPGIEASPDKLLQGRLFAYPDTQFHRLGPNFMKLPINCPFRVNNTQINGAMRFDGNEGGAPDYYPNRFHGPMNTGQPESEWTISNNTVARFDSNGDDQDNYSQPTMMWFNELDEKAHQNLVDNLAAVLSKAEEPIQKKMVENFGKVNAKFGEMMKEALGIK